MRYLSLVLLVTLLAACSKENMPTDGNTGNTPRKITYYYNGDGNNIIDDSMVIFLFKDENKVYFDSIIQIEVNGTTNVLRFNYSIFNEEQIIYKDAPIDSSQNRWAMKFKNNTFYKEYGFYNIYTLTYTDDFIGTYSLNEQKFEGYSSQAAGSGSGLSFGCSYDTDSAGQLTMEFFYSEYSPVEKKHQSTYLTTANKTQLSVLSGIPAHTDMLFYPYPGLNMPLVDKNILWNWLTEETSDMYEQFHYTFDGKDRVTYVYVDLMRKAVPPLADEVLIAKKESIRIEY